MSYRAFAEAHDTTEDPCLFRLSRSWDSTVLWTLAHCLSFTSFCLGIDVMRDYGTSWGPDVWELNVHLGPLSASIRREWNQPGMDGIGLNIMKVQVDETRCLDD